MLIHDQHNDFPLIPGEEVVSYKNPSDFYWKTKVTKPQEDFCP